MSLSAERAAFYRRRGDVPPFDPAAPATITLNALAQRARLTRRAILAAVHRGDLQVKKVKTRRNWRWEVEAAEGERFLTALREGKIGTATNGRKPWKR